MISVVPLNLLQEDSPKTYKTKSLTLICTQENPLNKAFLIR